MSATKMVTAVFTDRQQAILAYDWLRTSGYTIDEISVLMSDKTAPFFHAVVGEDKVEQKAHSAHGAEASGAIGASVGAGLTGLACMGISLIVGGPIGLALAATIPGAMLGGLVGGLVGYGFPESSAKEYEDLISNGGIALGVTPRTAEDSKLLPRKLIELHGEKVLCV